MSKNKKKQSQTIPLVPTSQSKRARRKKAKKLKKNIEGTNSIISSMPSIKANESKKSKKRRFLKEQQQKASVLTNSNVKINKKRAEFGEASSESDSEPIEADWASANDHSDKDDEKWQGEENVTRSFTNSNDDEQSDSEPSDNDLEDSEEDEDEELSENELNTLIQSQKKPMTKDTSKQKISCPKKKPLKRTHESVENTPTSAKKMKLVGESKQSIVKPLDKGDDQVSVSYSWTNESIIIDEIKKRAIELSSNTLYVSPLPPDYNESMLKSLSPSMMSYRLSMKRSKKMRSFAFLQYVDADTAEAARKAISGRLFAGKTISAQPNRLSFPISDLKSDNIDRTRLFVTGFNSSTTKNDLIHIFPKGTVDFPLTKDGITCGYAVVKFVNQNVSLEAFSTTHKRLVRGLPIFVNFMFSQKQNNENQLKVNNSKSNQSLEKMKEKQLNKPSSSEKTSNIVIHKTINTKDTGNKEGSNTKVLVQQLPESENDSKSSASDESNDESKSDELLVNQTKNKNSTTGKTSVLNELVSSKMLNVSPKNKAKSELSKMANDDSDDHDNDDDDDDDNDDDDEDNEDEDDEDEISEYDEDEEEDDDEDDDNDDDDDEDEDDEDEEDLGDTDSGDASEDSDEVVSEHAIKKDSQQKKVVNNNKPSALKNNSPITSVDKEQASSADSDDSSNEEIDKQLMAVIQAKRNAKKSFKSLKNAQKGKNEALNSAKHSGKKFKPQLVD
ncbi:unnamed protein product [Schistosoma spindalis]|nr:unnamed protein product [Schistosoma spindale]